MLNHGEPGNINLVMRRGAHFGENSGHFWESPPSSISQPGVDIASWILRCGSAKPLRCASERRNGSSAFCASQKDWFNSPKPIQTVRGFSKTWFCLNLVNLEGCVGGGGGEAWKGGMGGGMGGEGILPKQDATFAAFLWFPFYSQKDFYPQKKNPPSDGPIDKILTPRDLSTHL